MAVCVPTPRRPLRSTTWNAKFPAGLELDLSLPSAAPAPLLYAATSSAPAPKPRLRLPSLLATPSTTSCRFDPFADDEETQHKQENTPPAPVPILAQPLPRGRAPTPLTINPLPSVSTPTTGRRRAPSFSAGSTPGMRLSLSGASSPAPLLSRPSLPRVASAPAPLVPGAPSPFHARHYPTPDARCRLLARTLLNRIHAVGRPRSLYSCSSYSKTMCDGYESESGARAYVPSRLSTSVLAC